MGFIPAVSPLPQYNPDPSKVLGVFGLSLYTGERDLREMFEKYGPIKEVQVVYDHQVRKPCLLASTRGTSEHTAFCVCVHVHVWA